MFCLTATSMWVLGTAMGQEAPSEKPSAEPIAEPAEKPEPEQPDLFAVPDGTADELVQYIQKLNSNRPQARDEAGLREYSLKIARAFVDAGEKILAQESDDAQKSLAARAKFIGLSIFAREGDAKAKAALDKFPGELEQAGMVEPAQDLRAMRLQMQLRSTMRPDRDEERAKVIEEIMAFIQKGSVGPREASLAMAASQAQEVTGQTTKLVAATYRDFGKLLATSDNEGIVKLGLQMEGAARRVDLMGKKLNLEGIVLDGKPFDWAQYKGKVVLVDFWATWCRPCIQEMPNLLEIYDRYHDHGFEVVAISLDEDRERLEAFVQEREIPWPVLFDADPDAKSMVQYYGIFEIPSMVLVDADGKVVSLDARGPMLERELEKLLGPVEPKKKEVLPKNDT